MDLGRTLKRRARNEKDLKDNGSSNHIMALEPRS